MAKETLVTPEFRVGWTSMFTPEEKKDAAGNVVLDKSGKPILEYKLRALFAKGTDLSAMKKLAAAAAAEKWPNGAPKNLKSPFRDQGEKEKDGKLPDGYEEGAIFVNMKSSQRPGMVDANLQPVIDPTVIYRGCYGRAQVNAYAYGGPGTNYAPGVAFGLDNFQKTRDGDSLSGRVRAEDAFEPVADAAAPAGGGVFD